MVYVLDISQVGFSSSWSYLQWPFKGINDATIT